MAGETGGDWRVVGASVTGLSHLRAGQACQDAHRWHELASGVLLVAVADGAGTAPLSAVGASLAAQAAVAEAAERLRDCLPCAEGDWLLLLRGVFEAARGAVEAGAEARGHPAGDLATTLLLAVATPDFVAAGQVGDGAAVVRLADDRYVALTRPPAQEYVNETT